MNRATSESRQLDVNATGAIPTPDGRHVLLVKSNQSVTIAPFDTKTLSVTGPEVRVLSELGGNEAQNASSVALSASGTIAYFARSRRENQLVEVARSGALRVLPGRPDSYKDPRWSPDESKVSFVLSDGEVIGAVHVDDLRAGTRTRISSDAMDLYPLWSQDGKELFFASLRAGPIGVWRTRVDRLGTDTAWTIKGTAARGHTAAIAPDGRTLLYRVTGTNGLDVYAAPIDGSEDGRPILNSPYDEMAPDISRDQRWLAYVSTESGRDEVYVTAWPGLGARRQISSGGGDEPRWNPKGGELFYRNGDALIAVRLEERDGLPAAVRRDTLFQGAYRSQVRWAQYDVSADGQRFLMIREGARKDPVVVITNWLAGAIETLERGG